MIDITHKQNTYRKAIARAVLTVGSLKTIEAIETNQVPKGNVFEMARTAGLLGVKKTAQLIPDCHPIPIEFTTVSFEVKDLSVIIDMEVATIYKTGVEVEAMHGVSLVALTMYDMLKPIDKSIEITSIRLIEKQGGKSDYKEQFKQPIRSAVVVCSDTISAGQKEDKAGKRIIEKLSEFGVENDHYVIIPDDPAAIQEQFSKMISQQMDLIVFTGGTGLSSRDVTPDTIRPLLDKEIPGITEVMRKHGQDRMPYAMLSRSIAGVKGKSLVLTLPGSTGGAVESVDAIFPQVLHIFKILSGARH